MTRNSTRQNTADMRAARETLTPRSSRTRQNAHAIRPGNKARKALHEIAQSSDLRKSGKMRLLIATKNAHKTEEIRSILGEPWQVEDLTGNLEIEAPKETGSTFEENAAIKAVEASRRFAEFVLADDSGLEVDALGGAPGVVSARYAGPKATDADNCTRLLRELRTFPSPARFRCVMCLARGGRVLGTFRGAVEGAIIGTERGRGGFGYDPLFLPEGYSETFGELSPEIKNRLSHRARTLVSVREFLIKFVDAPNGAPA